MTGTICPLVLRLDHARQQFCGPDKSCTVLEEEVCRFPFVARPSMEAVGINVYKMVAAAGWEIYPIGHSTRAEDIPRATLAGIVIVQ